MFNLSKTDVSGTFNSKAFLKGFFSNFTIAAAYLEPSQTSMMLLLSFKEPYNWKIQIIFTPLYFRKLLY